MLLALLLATASPALANGQTTHIWITRHALEHVPDGPLRDLLTDPANEAALVHGSMFPDGGYAVDHPYGEAGHWEPLQGRYADWIRAEHPAPFDDAGERHVAFLLGMASHGMADQTFDGFYFNWSSIKDAEAGWAQGKSFDEASDFIWAAETGAQEVPDRWMPDTTLVELYNDAGIGVDTDTLDAGQDLLETAVALVGFGSQNPDLVQSYADQFPWGGAHLADEDLPGTPACEGEWVALYWEELYARLTEEARPRPVLGTWPPDGGMGHPRDHTLPEARVSLVFPVGAQEGSLEASWFGIVGEDGSLPAFEPWIYYGRDSHVVHLVPAEDWAPDTDYVVTARAGIPYRDGTALAEDVSFRFSTRPPPPEDTGVPTDEGEAEARPAGQTEAGGCATLPLGAGGLLAALGLLGAAARRR